MAAVTLTNLAGYVWSIPADETAAGINVQKVQVKADGDKYVVKDRKALPHGRADFAFKQEYSISGFVTDVTKIFASTIGVLVTVANAVALGGIPITAAAFLDDITAEYTPGEPAKLDYKVTVYNDIAATVTQVAG